MWIGLNDFALDGTMEWSSGVPVTYENWYPGEPSNSGEGSFAEHCVVMYANTDIIEEIWKHTWVDTHCRDLYDTYQFVCSTH